MENKVKQVVVVEGKNDQTRLKQIFSIDVLITNGYAITNKQIELIKKINSLRGIIILTDQDNAGIKIREKINFYVKDCKNLFLNKEMSVEKTPLNELAEILKKEIEFVEKKQIKINDFYKLGLLGKNNSKNLRNKVSNYYNIEKHNGKSLLAILNMLNVKLKDLKEVLDNE